VSINIKLEIINKNLKLLLKSFSFLENIVSVRGSNNPQDNINGDYNETNEFTMVSLFNLLDLFFYVHIVTTVATISEKNVKLSPMCMEDYYFSLFYLLPSFFFTSHIYFSLLYYNNSEKIFS
jgi:hypothetical protein